MLLGSSSLSTPVTLDPRIIPDGITRWLSTHHSKLGSSITPGAMGFGGVEAIHWCPAWAYGVASTQDTLGTGGFAQVCAWPQHPGSPLPAQADLPKGWHVLCKRGAAPCFGQAPSLMHSPGGLGSSVQHPTCTRISFCSGKLPHSAVMGSGLAGCGGPSAMPNWGSRKELQNNGCSRKLQCIHLSDGTLRPDQLLRPFPTASQAFLFKEQLVSIFP